MCHVSVAAPAAVHNILVTVGVFLVISLNKENSFAGALIIGCIAELAT